MDGLYKRAGSPKYYALLKDPRAKDGYRRLSTGCTTEREAAKVAKRLQEEIDQQVQEMDGLRWFDAAEDFIRRSPRKDSTKRGYTSLVENVMNSCLGNFNLRTLTHDDLKRFVQEKRRSKVRVNGREKPLDRNVTDATIRRHLSFMSAVVRWSMDQDLQGAPSENVVRTFDRSGLKESKIVDRHLRKPQFEKILEQIKNPEDKRIILVLVGTGLRLSEFLELRWGEVDLKNRVIEFGNLDPLRTKSSKARRIPILPVVYEALTAQCAMSFTDDTAYVFPSPVGGGRRYGLSSLQKRIKKIPGLEKFRIHDLRHTFASWALQNGVDQIALMRVLGHSGLQTTSRYAHHISDSVLQAFRTSDFL